MASIAEHLSSRKLSWDSAAEKAGVSVGRLREVADGAQASLGEMKRIAKALRVPLSAMLGDTANEPIRLLFRQTIGQRADAFSSSLEVISSQIHDALSIAQAVPRSLRWLEGFRALPAPSVASAVQYAEAFRLLANLDSTQEFTTLFRVAETLGVFVLFSRDSTVEGVSAIVDGHAFVLLGPRTFAPRMLFTLAHEFGHLVAHNGSGNEGYALVDTIEDMDPLARSPRRGEEQFADAFAGLILLPTHGVLKALKTIRELKGISGPLGDIEISYLARFYGVSFEVAAFRCEQLDLLPARGARALYEELLENFCNPERRADQLGLPPRPEMEVGSSPTLLRAAAQQVKAGGISIGRAAELLNVPVSALFAANT